jgi:hypothetical protein
LPGACRIDSVRGTLKVRVCCGKKVTGGSASAVWKNPTDGLTVEFLKHLLGGFDAMVLRFLKDGDAAEVGIGEQDPVLAAF